MVDEELQKEIKQILGERRGRKKKPVPKPWGRRERLLVLGVFIATVFAMFVAWLRPQTPQGFSLPKIELLGEETIVFEKEKLSAEEQIKVEKARQEFRELTGRLSGTYGFYVFNLATKKGYGMKENEVFPTASLNKLPVMLTLYQEAEKGNISLETRYTLKDSDKVGGAGSLQYKPAGTVVTYRELARLMGKQSDNTAFNVLSSLLGDNRVQKTIEELGMEKTFFALYQTTPRDIGILFRKLWGGGVVSDKSRDEILEFLTDTAFEDGWMPDGVPKGVRVAHKIGVEENSISDAGIIFAERPFVLVLMSHGVIESEAKRILPDLVRIFWEAEK